MTYTATELYNVGLVCLNLYREAEAARTPEQLEAAAERFGKAMGGVGLRGSARGGLRVGAGTRAQVSVADGTVVQSFTFP